MKVILSFCAWASGLSGGDRHLLESAARWRAHVDIEAIAPANAHETIAEHLGDVRLHTRGLSGRTIARAGPALALEYVHRAVLAELRPPRADVVVAASHFLPDAAAVHAGRRAGAHGVAFVYHLVASRTDRSLRTAWSRLDESAGLRLIGAGPATVFSSNGETLTELSRRGFSPLRTDVGLDVASFHTTDPAARSGPSVLFLARLVPKKGVRDIITAWPHVLEHVPAARLTVAGTGPELASAKRLAEQLGVAHTVEWPGFVPESEKRTLLARARVFVAPSYEEGWGIAVAEAMAAGAPVVASDIPVLREVGGTAVVWAPPGDTSAWAMEIDALLANPAARERLREAGRRQAAGFSWSAAASALRAVLAEAAAIR